MNGTRSSISLKTSSLTRGQLMYTEARCSVCHNIFLRKSTREKRCSICRDLPRYTKVRYTHTVTCKVCGKQFETDLYNKYFCSKECRDKYHYIPELVHKTCEVCGKDFTTGRKNQKYCSEECRIKRNEIRKEIQENVRLYGN